jgi:hypothetical protein
VHHSGRVKMTPRHFHPRVVFGSVREKGYGGVRYGTEITENYKNRKQTLIMDFGT